VRPIVIDAPPLPDERTLGELTRSVSEFALLSTAIIGLAWACFALGEQVEDARVQVRIAAAPDSGPVLTVTRASAVLVHRALSRFFDVSWSDRPGGAAAKLAALLARHAAVLHGARLDVSSQAGAGTRVT
jgi:hypothetical protein